MGQHLLDGEVDDRGGHGLAAGRQQRLRAEQLGGAEQREDVDRRRAAAAAEGAAGHHAGGVRRHDDRDGRQWLALLGRPHARRQGVERDGARSGGGDVDRHVIERTNGVSRPPRPDGLRGRGTQ